ncbi:helix-turn-helix domain-containing protein [Fodinisporobacter ferrooxydans]|uniref:Helix-turn-helix domain-containing protein n=2 Tax=Fodinisporobacter ferrooxydans TaxID=2901836 RepID=A0ABY4CR35_9BACL|nr:helix-turn-helix domain-containing protein [Alicyclobacillaceae bacterium MYW30-H2]
MRLTQMEVANKLGISNGTLSGYERNYRDPDTETLKKLADLYEVSVDYLLNGKTETTSISLPDLSPKEERDIAHEVEKLMSGLESDESMTFYGEPMDEESKELLRISLENSLTLAKKMAKQKFTPKKYRKK